MFVVELILIGVLDRVETALPHDREWDDSISNGLGSYERGAIEAAGMALGVLYCNLTGDGMGICDALAVADRFDQKVEQLFTVAWEDQGVAVKQRQEKWDARLKETGMTYHIPTLFTNWPDVHKCAVSFVDKTLTCYILGDPNLCES